VSWILAIVLAPLALSLAILALPFHARARGSVAEGDLSGEVAVEWAFGLLGLELGKGGFALRLAGLRFLRLRRARRGGGEPRRAARKREEARAGGRKGPLARLRAAVAGSPRLARMATRLARTLHLRLRLSGRVGTGDPADTAAVAAMVRAAGALPGLELEVSVDWLDEVLDLEADGSAWVWAPQVLVVVGVLWLERENRAALRALSS